jgi:hypothetical protein
LSPDEISRSLGQNPKTSWKVGAEKRRPDGTAIGGIYEHTYWTSEEREGEDDELLTMLDSDLSEFEKHASFFDEFHATGGHADYYISWFASDISGGEGFSPRQLGRLAALHMNLSLDVYSRREGGPLSSRI